MILITLRDMQWRARRIVLGLSATALVLAMASLLGALHDGFLRETDRTIDFFGADSWLVASQVAGPFTSNTPVRTALVDRVLRDPGVRAATPVAIFRHVVRGVDPDGFTDVNVIGYQPGGIVNPHPVAGRAPAGTGEALVDSRLGLRLGTPLRLAGRTVRVVGQVSGLTYNGGTPTIVVTLQEAQAVAFDGRPLASALVVSGALTDFVPGLTSMTSREVRDDLRRPLSVATSAIGLVAALLWVVAAGIVAMLAYLSGLDRYRDFAVFKALGATTRRLVRGGVVEGAGGGRLAAVAAVSIAFALAPLFPVDIDLSASDAVRLVVVALLVGVVAGTVSMRGAVRVDPAQAFANA
jgi:putative ABC transport system permease protein